MADPVNPYAKAYNEAASRQAASKGTARRTLDGKIASVGGIDNGQITGPIESQWNENNDIATARNRSAEISKEMETTQGDEGEYERIRDSWLEDVNQGYGDAANTTANSFAGRGLGSSGLAMREQYDLASKRERAIDDVTLKARAQAQAMSRADLAQEQTGLVGVQTSDINAQRLALEEQQMYDQALADAIGALSQYGGQYLSGVKSKADKAAAAEADAAARAQAAQSAGLPGYF